MASTMRRLPVNVTDRERLLFCVDNNIQNAEVSTHLVDQPLERATPIRDFVAWPGKRNYEGLWWSSTAQPLAILWPRATPSNVNHVPDFFIRLAGGDGRIVDVRHPDRVMVAAQQSALTRRLCDRIGWQYQQFTGLAAVLAANLRWLAGYRHDRHTPRPQVREALISAFTRPAPLHLGIGRASIAAGAESDIVTAGVFHLLWCRVLHADLDQPLSMQSEVVA